MLEKKGTVLKKSVLKNIFLIRTKIKTDRQGLWITFMD